MSTAHGIFESMWSSSLSRCDILVWRCNDRRVYGQISWLPLLDRLVDHSSHSTVGHPCGGLQRTAMVHAAHHVKVYWPNSLASYPIVTCVNNLREWSTDNVAYWLFIHATLWVDGGGLHWLKSWKTSIAIILITITVPNVIYSLVTNRYLSQILTSVCNITITFYY